jgi:hypothetical protein
MGRAVKVDKAGRRGPSGADLDGTTGSGKSSHKRATRLVRTGARVAIGEVAAEGHMATKLPNVPEGVDWPRVGWRLFFGRLGAFLICGSEKTAGLFD